MSTFQKDLAERVVRTFVQAALAVVASGLVGLTDLDSAKTLGISALAAGFSAVMGLIGHRIGDPNTGSFAKLDQNHEVPEDLVELHQLLELRDEM